MATWNKATDDQGGAQGDQSDALTQFNAKVAAINAARRDIQLAADTVWPHTDPANAGTRKLFGLPIDRPLPA